MLLLSLGATSDELILTLTEKALLSSPFYLFTATHVTTREIVAFVLPSDLSGFPARFNRFLINTSSIFSGKTPGGWLYKIYEQPGNVNIDPTGLNLVEQGKLTLKPTSEFSYQKGYEPQTSYQAYGG